MVNHDNRRYYFSLSFYYERIVMIRFFKKAQHLYEYRKQIKESVLIISLIYIYLLYNGTIKRWEYEHETSGKVNKDFN